MDAYLQQDNGVRDDRHVRSDQGRPELAPSSATHTARHVACSCDLRDLDWTRCWRLPGMATESVVAVATQSRKTSALFNQGRSKFDRILIETVLLCGTVQKGEEAKDSALPCLVGQNVRIQQVTPKHSRTHSHTRDRTRAHAHTRCRTRPRGPRGQPRTDAVQECTRLHRAAGRP